LSDFVQIQINHLRNFLDKYYFDYKKNFRDLNTT